MICLALVAKKWGKDLAVCLFSTTFVCKYFAIIEIYCTLPI